MPLTATIQKKKKPSAPSWASGLSAGPNNRSKGRSISSKPRRRTARTAAITPTPARQPDLASSCAHRTAPFAQQDPAEHQQRERRDHAAEHQPIVDAVSPGARVVDRADELEPVDEAAQ